MTVRCDRSISSAVDDSEDLTALLLFDGDQLRRQLETAFDGMCFIYAERDGKDFQLTLQGRRKGDCGVIDAHRNYSISYSYVEYLDTVVRFGQIRVR
jgi:predicted site-specific integrase-resolvase